MLEEAGSCVGGGQWQRERRREGRGGGDYRWSALREECVSKREMRAARKIELGLEFGRTGFERVKQGLHITSVLLRDRRYIILHVGSEKN